MHCLSNAFVLITCMFGQETSALMAASVGPGILCITSVEICAQAFLLGGDVQLQFARAWAVAVAAYGCDVVRPLLLRKFLHFPSSPLSPI